VKRVKIGFRDGAFAVRRVQNGQAEKSTPEAQLHIKIFSSFLKQYATSARGAGCQPAAGF
jgi:hypothetical protein